MISDQADPGSALDTSQLSCLALISRLVRLCGGDKSEAARPSVVTAQGRPDALPRDLVQTPSTFRAYRHAVLEMQRKIIFA